MSDFVTPSSRPSEGLPGPEPQLPPEEPWITDDDFKTDPAAARSTPPAGPSVSVKGPLVMVETAFLASAASLMWLINLYFPPGPLLRILFPLPIALVYLRWNVRAAGMATLVSGILLSILIGPPRSLLFVIPYGILGMQLGFLWRRQARWSFAIGVGALIVTFGMFFRIWLLSWMAGEDLWGYLVAQITQILDWITNRLLDLGLVSLGGLGRPSMMLIQVAAVIVVFFSSVIYLFTVHLAAWLVLERLGVAMSRPPQWVQTLIDE
jgi:uncharacterized protein YybS (DUF2232 family)